MNCTLLQINKHPAVGVVVKLSVGPQCQLDVTGEMLAQSSTRSNDYLQKHNSRQRLKLLQTEIF